MLSGPARRAFDLMLMQLHTRLEGPKYQLTPNVLSTMASDDVQFLLYRL